MKIQKPRQDQWWSMLENRVDGEQLGVVGKIPWR